jgi:hypothetical protein
MTNDGGAETVQESSTLHPIETQGALSPKARLFPWTMITTKPTSYDSGAEMLDADTETVTVSVTAEEVVVDHSSPPRIWKA